MKVYVLKDPTTNEIRYVGVTSQSLNQRLSQHINAAKNHQRHVCNWIKSLLDQGLRPIIEQIDDVEDWEEKERYYIKYYRDQGCNLTNTQEGGSGVVTADMRSKSSMERSAEGHKKAIYQIDADLNIVREWKSQTDAARELGLKQNNIGNSITYRRAAYGYFWVKVADYDTWKPEVKFTNEKGKGRVKIQSNL